MAERGNKENTTKKNIEKPRLGSPISYNHHVKSLVLHIHRLNYYLADYQIKNNY
jgi:hypothetical protein